MNKTHNINVIGGGLAGVEAAWQAAEMGASVRLYEMRPMQQTPAHRTDKLAEIVCSNSLKTDEPGSAPYLLKEELRRGRSLVMEAAEATKIPAGAALAVDRVKFAEIITERIEAHPDIEIVREEVTTISPDEITVIATGPLTSDALTREIMRLTGDDQLYFYDAIAPIVAADSIDMSVAFKAARYGKGGDDYINCPMSPEQYEVFFNDLIAAKSVPVKRFEDTQWFESCLPIEEAARRGVDTLRYGPMKPRGLPDPRTGREPWACVQLRQENMMADAYGIVGFQNHLKYGEQERVLRLIPGLENADFLQFGQIHRNTFINSPKILNESLETRANAHIFFAGQITGVEGYVESVATGWLAGINAVRLSRDLPMLTAPQTSATGALCRYVSNVETKNFQPVNITFGLLEPLPVELRKKYRNKRERHTVQVERALKDWDEWLPETRSSVSERGQPARMSAKHSDDDANNSTSPAGERFVEPKRLRASSPRSDAADVRIPIENRHRRGYLPHFDADGFTQFITFRLADSLPSTFLSDLSFRLKNKLILEIEYHRQVELCLDTGQGPLHLNDYRIADCLAETITRFDAHKYELHAWVIMPNHVHLLVSPRPEHSVSEIVHSIKSYSSNFANKCLDREGRFWSSDYFDRFMRDRVHYQRSVNYIENNPVKAGLCQTAAEWRWSSAYGRRH